eukprot:CAMPEP_0197291586 /NCGR_PEP_ID=MMETSP0890-20130614/17243_1 /TAXON_ID=44058 ORGANISM="Aureoumbra lagunensis, Strain CCMP1510" /NCGR_SAMPLE_ID=MMETSP0890 /ASSEMBLY_ACC=CAM_ASM_000533 /LENGTH=221 /DNA_ID=CAMNT_0042764771 /DNA_START=152 /DNA_END=817 /DNA_ORIENTATION=+
MKMQMQMGNQFSVFSPDLECIFLDGIHECTREEATRSDPALRQFFPESDYGPYREWWNSGKPDEEGNIIYERFDECIQYVSEILAKEHFDGIIGFSQGGSLAANIVAMSIKGQLQSSHLKWAWIQSSFIPRHSSKSLHVANDLFSQLKSSGTEKLSNEIKVLVTTHEQDPIVPSRATRSLANAFPDSTYISFPGKVHRLVSLRDPADPNVQAIKSFFSSIS